MPEWLERRKDQAAAVGDIPRAWRLANLIGAAEHRAIQSSPHGVSQYSDFD